MSTRSPQIWGPHVWCALFGIAEACDRWEQSNSFRDKRQQLVGLAFTCGLCAQSACHFLKGAACTLSKPTNGNLTLEDSEQLFHEVTWDPNHAMPALWWCFRLRHQVNLKLFTQDVRSGKGLTMWAHYEPTWTTCVETVQRENMTTWTWWNACFRAFALLATNDAAQAKHAWQEVWRPLVFALCWAYLTDQTNQTNQNNDPHGYCQAFVDCSLATDDTLPNAEVLLAQWEQQ